MIEIQVLLQTFEGRHFQQDNVAACPVDTFGATVLEVLENGITSKISTDHSYRESYM
jgi:hypothetical protein